MLDPLLKKSSLRLLALLSCVSASFPSSVPVGRRGGPQPYVPPTASLQLRESISSPVAGVEVSVRISLEGLRPQPRGGWGEKQSVLFEVLGEWAGSGSQEKLGKQKPPNAQWED